MRERRKRGKERAAGVGCIPHPGVQNPAGKTAFSLCQGCNKPTRVCLMKFASFLNTCKSITIQSTEADMLLIFWLESLISVFRLCCSEEIAQKASNQFGCFCTECVNEYIRKESFHIYIEMCFLKFSSNPLSANI